MLAALAGVAVVAVAAGCAAATPVAGTTPPQPGGLAPGQPHPGPPSVHPTVAAACPSAKAGGHEVWFTDAAGVALGGIELGTGSKGVVLSHMAGGDSCQWLPFGRQLAAAGYRVIALDLAGSGASAQLTGEDKRDANVVAAAAYLHGHGVMSVVLIGASMGGNASLVAATEVSPPVSGVISLSAPATYQGLDAAAAVTRLAVPVLYIAGSGESEYASAARALYAATPGNTKNLFLASGSQHGTQLLDKPEPDAAKVRAAVLDFLKAHAPV